MQSRLETDAKEDGEVEVAYQLILGGNAEPVDLTALTLDQLRRFSSKVGCTYVNSKNKFQCRKALWIQPSYLVGRAEHTRMLRELPMTTTYDKTTSTIIRITNIVFSGDFCERFLALNDSKTRADHETREIPKDFWADVAETMTGSADDDSSALTLVISDKCKHREEIDSVDLHKSFS